MTQISVPFAKASPSFRSALSLKALRPNRASCSSCTRPFLWEHLASRANPASWAEPVSWANPSSWAELASWAEPVSCEKASPWTDPASWAKPSSWTDPASWAKPSPWAEPALCAKAEGTPILSMRPSSRPRVTPDCRRSSSGSNEGECFADTMRPRLRPSYAPPSSRGISEMAKSSGISRLPQWQGASTCFAHSAHTTSSQTPHPAQRVGRNKSAASRTKSPLLPIHMRLVSREAPSSLPFPFVKLCRREEPPLLWILQPG